MLLPLVVLAAATQSWGLKWKAPAGCIEPAQLARAVEGKLGFSVFGAGAKHRIDGELTKSGSTWRASFIAVDAEGSILGSRELTSEDASCHALDDKLAMVVAVMIDPKRQAPEVPEQLPPPPPTPRPEPSPPPQAQLREVDPAVKEEYEKRLIHFGDWVAVNQTGAVVGQGASLYEGKYMKPLTPVEFYERIGETDRVAQLNSASKKRSAVAIPGGVLVLLGLTSIFAGIAIAGDCNIDVGGSQAQFYACIQRRNQIRDISLWSGVGAAGAGAVLVVISLLIPYPVDTLDVMREKADVYNKRLRRELGIEVDAPGSEPERAPPPGAQASVGITPLVFSGGGGAALTVTF